MSQVENPFRSPDRMYEYDREPQVRDATSFLRELGQNDFSPTIKLVKEQQSRIGRLLLSILCNGKPILLDDNLLDLKDFIDDGGENKIEFITLEYESILTHPSIEISEIGQLKRDQLFRNALDPDNETPLLYDAGISQDKPKKNATHFSES